MSKVCQRFACGKRGDDLKRCGRCKMVWYCSVKCQRKEWPEHAKTCKRNKLPKPESDIAAALRLVSCSTVRELLLAPEVDEALYQHCVETDAYSDTQVILGHAVKLGVTEDGYWVSVDKQVTQLGKLEGMMLLTAAIDRVMRQYNKPIDGMSAAIKLQEAIARRAFGGGK